MEDLFFKFIPNIGVPAAVCFYTLYGVKASLDKLTGAIDQLGESHSKEISNLKDELKELKFKVEHWEARYNAGR